MTRKLKHKVNKGKTECKKERNKKDAMKNASKHGAQLFGLVDGRHR
jgi:hypothetical protein